MELRYLDQENHYTNEAFYEIVELTKHCNAQKT